MADGSKWKISCSSCDTRFQYPSQLKKHILYMHTATNQKINCDLCGKSFVRKGDLNVHVRNHFGVKNIICPLCGKGFTKNHNLMKHQNFFCSKIKKVKQFQCTQCPKRFCSTTSLNFHIKSHEAEIIKCDVCNYQSNDKFRVKNHIKAVHQQEKLFECKYCKAKYSDKYRLSEHEKAYCKFSPKDLKYGCDICLSTFNAEVKLKAHVKRMHTAKTYDYECKICGKSFYGKANLYTHSYIHNPKHQCGICYKTFSVKRDLENHCQRGHIETNDKTEACTQCDYKATRKSYLNRHIKSKHEGRTKSTESRAYKDVNEELIQ